MVDKRKLAAAQERPGDNGRLPASMKPSDADASPDLGILGMIAANATGTTKRDGKEKPLWPDVDDMVGEVATTLRQRLGLKQAPEAPAAPTQQGPTQGT